MPAQLSLEEFGKKIKAKYPQYNSLSDTDIANKVLLKYPQYKSAIKYDFTSNPKGEGLYRMSQSPGREGKSNTYVSLTGPEIQVPFSRVQDAIGAGYRLHFDDEPRYTKDRTYQGEGPTLLEKANTKIQSLLQPSTGVTGSLPIGIAPMNINQAKAAGRVFYSTPGFLMDLAKAAYDPEVVKNSRGTALLDLLDPAKIPEGLKQQFQEDMKTSPKLAVDNLIGTLEGMGGVGLLTHAATKVVPTLAEKPIESVRQAGQTILGAGTRVVKGAVEKAAEDANKTAENVTSQNTADQVEHQQSVRDTRAANVKSLQEHLGEVDKVAAERAAAEAIPDARKALADQIVKDSAERSKRIIKAQNKAKAAANKRYDAQRQLLDNETIPPSITPGALTDKNISSRIVDAYTSRITGTEGPLPKIIKSINERMNQNDPMTWRDLQGYRSEIGEKLSGGNLPGDEYQGYKAALEVVDDGLQKIADNFGVGKQVKADRAFYRRYMETFHDPIYEPNTVARKSQTATSGDYVSDTEEQARRQKLAQYDPTIATLGDAIDSAKQRLSDLPTEKGSRGGLKEFPQVPEMDKPKPLNQKPIEVPEVDVTKMRNDFIDKKLASWTDVSRWQIARLLTGPIGAIIGFTTGHPLVGDIGAAYAVAELTPFAIQRMLDNPSVRGWFVRPPAGELEVLQKVPYADRIRIINGLNQVARQAANEKKPLAISPIVASFLAGQAATQQPKQSLEDLKKEAEQRKPVTNLQHEDSKAQIPEAVQRVMDAMGVKCVKGKGFIGSDGKEAIASVSEHEPSVVEINNPSKFQQGPLQTIGHEVTHIWRHNLPGPLQKAALPDSASNRYDISNIEKLRAKGYTLATIPEEQAASIVQRYIASPADRPKLQDWIDDMNVTPLSIMIPTRPSDNKINLSVRPPMVPPPSSLQKGFGLDLPQIKAEANRIRPQ